MATISIKELSATVDQAVITASEKHRIKFSHDFVIGPGTIIGRQLLEGDIGVKQAQQIANDIAQHVTSAGGAAAATTQKFEPAVLIRPGGTTCGMICPTNVEFHS